MPKGNEIDNSGKCHLCLQERKLCRSHIIPEFFYKPSYDEKHRIHVLFTEKGKHPRDIQKGLRERLLCESCETKLSKLEKYGREVIYGGQEIEILEKSNSLEVPVDYTKFKLFQLSILWRMGVSSLDYFAKYDLGAHEETLRSMVFREKPGASNTYGCMIVSCRSYPDITNDMVHPMGIDALKNIKCARLLAGGLFWLFFLSSEVNHPLNEWFLQEDGLLKIVITEVGPKEYIEQLSQEYLRANPRKSH